MTSAFCLGAAPGPAKLTANLVQRLWSDQSEEISFDINGKRKEKMVDLFYENPRNFILECARLNSILPMVSLLSNDNIVRDVKEHTGVEIPANTRIHCSLMKVESHKRPKNYVRLVIVLDMIYHCKSSNLLP